MPQTNISLGVFHFNIRGLIVAFIIITIVMLTAYFKKEYDVNLFLTAVAAGLTANMIYSAVQPKMVIPQIEQKVQESSQNS